MKNLAICFTLILFCSCTIHRRIYSSTQINNPSLQKKNDHSFSLAYNAPSGFDFTGGYAITNRLAAIAGAYIYKNKDEEQDASYFYPQTFSTTSLLYRNKGFHGGLGVYFPFTKKNSSGFCSFFGGYTKGNFRMDENLANFYKSNIARYFLQGGLNSYKKDFEISLVCRYNYVSYSNVITNYTTDQQHNLNFPPLGYSKYSQFLDVAFDSKIFFTNKPRIAVQFFVFTTTRLNKKELNFNYYHIRAGLGIVIKNPFTKK
jgi:hypothetical protein